MSIEDKIKNAKPTDWELLKMPQWKIKLLIWWADIEIKLIKLVRKRLDFTNKK